MKMSKIIIIELTKADMQLAVQAYIQPKIKEVLKTEIDNGTQIKYSHRYLTASVTEVSVDI